jgi:hypothetical protein
MTTPTIQRTMSIELVVQDVRVLLAQPSPCLLLKVSSSILQPCCSLTDASQMQSRHAILSPFYRKLNRRSTLAWLRWLDTVVEEEAAVAAVVEDGDVVVMVVSRAEACPSS